MTSICIKCRKCWVIWTTKAVYVGLLALQLGSTVSYTHPLAGTPDRATLPTHAIQKFADSDTLSKIPVHEGGNVPTRGGFSFAEVTVEGSDGQVPAPNTHAAQETSTSFEGTKENIHERKKFVKALALAISRVFLRVPICCNSISGTNSALNFSVQRLRHRQHLNGGYDVCLRSECAAITSAFLTGKDAFFSGNDYVTNHTLVTCILEDSNFADQV